MDFENNGGPAFPFDRIMTDRGSVICSDGMTLRDYFAAKALMGDMASGVVHSGEFQSIAARAYKMADAMLEARKQ